MITITVPISARPYFTGNIFTATFNTTVANRYSFPGGQNQTVIPVRKRCTYLLDKLFFSANMDEGVYQSAIDGTTNLPELTFSLKSQESKPLFPQPYKLINYFDNLDNVLFWTGVQDDDELQMSFKGQFSQPAAIVGQTVMNAYVQLVIYEMTETEWNNRYILPKNDLGAGINMRGRY